MSLFKEIKFLLVKDFKLELKQQNNIYIVVLYSVSSIFLIYMLFSENKDIRLWNTLFWLTNLFATIGAINRSFVNESGARHIYFYSLVSPQALIIAKIIFNIFFLTLLSTINLLLFILIFDILPHSALIYFLAVWTGTAGFCTILTMIAAIASRTSNNFLMMSILGFPVVIPMLLAISKITEILIVQESYNVLAYYFGLLIFLMLASFLLSLVLFPYIWRD